jgi:hypothetical protein
MKDGMNLDLCTFAQHFNPHRGQHHQSHHPISYV